MLKLAFDLKHALRSLVKTRPLFATAVLLFALGIGATTAIFSMRVLREE